MDNFGMDEGEKLAHPAMRRVDQVRVDLHNEQAIPTTLFASRHVPVERDGVEQALGVLGVQDTVMRLHEHDPDFFGGSVASLERMVLTPDFHRGGGIPVGTVAATRGFVLPQAVGNDVCCGMRVLMTDLTREDLERHEPELIAQLRGIFFEGKRDIAMSPVQREAMLRQGLHGLLETSSSSGSWHGYRQDQQEDELERVHFGGKLEAKGVFAFEDFIVASGRDDGRDAQIGSVGGGNHFVELQVIEELFDNHSAYAWGIEPGRVAIMVHSGSVGLGHRVGRHFLERTRSIYPKGLKHPGNGFYPLPVHGPHAGVYQAYRDAMFNAANFAFANRLFLGLMVRRALEDVTGREVMARLLYDAPHNLIWDEPATGHVRHVHRKGACPAYGPDPESDGPFAYTGQPVLVPGSMGDSSYVMAGQGRGEALCSACHGAGRKLARGVARKRLDGAGTDDLLERLRIVTPMDVHGQMLRQRPDIRARYLDRIREEAPHSYKDVAPVVETIESAEIARRVARHEPWLTIKSS